MYLGKDLVPDSKICHKEYATLMLEEHKKLPRAHHLYVWTKLSYDLPISMKERI